MQREPAPVRSNDPAREVASTAQPKRDFIPAVTSWSLSIDEAVAQAVERSPMVSQFDKQVRASASHVWRDVESAWAQVKAEIVASPNNVMPVIQRIEREPHSYGELLGGRTLLLLCALTRNAKKRLLTSLGLAPSFMNTRTRSPGWSLSCARKRSRGAQL